MIVLLIILAGGLVILFVPVIGPITAILIAVLGVGVYDLLRSFGIFILIAAACAFVIFVLWVWADESKIDKARIKREQEYQKRKRDGT